MGIYLNPGNDAFFSTVNYSEIYVDKTMLIDFTNKCLFGENKEICVSRPRRFGKSIAENMLTAYYSKGCDSKELFSKFKISETPDFEKHLNQYNVIHVDIQNFMKYSVVKEMIQRLTREILFDISVEFPDVKLFDENDLTRSLKDIFAQKKQKFIFIIDEWDCIFREYREDHEAQKVYLDFLRDWLKDKAYIGLAYMTGILPIKKYGTHSALNMFAEYSMTNAVPLDPYMGFTTDEVKALSEKYQVSFDEVKSWYDGYFLKNIGDIYSPRSVVQVMKTGIFDDYWNQTETFDALKVYIDMNYDGLRDAVLALMAGGRIKIDIRTFSNDMTTFSGYQDVLTLLIHLGYLGYDFDEKEVFIPNREVLMEFVSATRASKWDEIMHSVVLSEDLLKAAWKQDADRVAQGIEKAHLETSHLQYNDENALSYTISLAFYAARQYYTVIRELPTGEGFADVAFIPRRKYADKPAMVVELKWKQDADTAIQQILEKNYPEGLSEYKDNLLLIGINYDKKTRKHTCIIEKA